MYQNLYCTCRVIVLLIKPLLCDVLISRRRQPSPSAVAVPDCNNMSEKIRKEMKSRPSKSVARPASSLEAIWFSRKIWKMSTFFHAHYFETNSWMEIPEKHTREKSSYSVTQEIPAYFTTSTKLK